MVDIQQKMLLSWPDVGYDEADDKVRAFYSQNTGTTTNKHSIFYKKFATDVFIAALALGKKAGKNGIRKDFSDGKKAKNIPREVFANNPKYVWMMIAVALEETHGDDKIFENSGKIVEICEEYANYGIHLLIGLDEKASVDDPYFGFEEKMQELIDSLPHEQ